MLAIGFVSDDVAVISFAFSNGRPDLARLVSPEGLAGLYYRPLVDLTYAIDFTIWGWNPFGYRLTALLLHLASTGFLFLLVRRLYGRHHLALMSAALFGLLPIHEMSLFWIAGRTDLLCGFFYLLSLWLLARNVQRDGIPAWSFLGTPLLAFLGALLSKEMAFSLPLIVPLVAMQAWRVQGKKVEMRSLLRVTLPFLLLPVALVSVRWLVLGNDLLGSDHGLHGNYSVVGIARNIGIYLGLLVVPAGHHAIEGMLAAHRTLFTWGAIATFLLAGALVLRFRSRLHPFVFPLLWTLLTILPVSRLVMRWYLYIPSVGFCIAMASIFGSISRQKAARRWVPRLVLGMYGAILIWQSAEWIYAGRQAREYLAGLGQEVQPAKGDTLTFLNIPSKIGTAPVFNLGFQRTVQHYLGRPDLHVRILSKTVIEGEPVHISMRAADIPGAIILRIDDNGYFFLDNADIKAGRATAEPGALLPTDDGTARILSMNRFNRPDGIELPLENQGDNTFIFDGSNFRRIDTAIFSHGPFSPLHMKPHGH